jgi:hypothetical protein
MGIDASRYVGCPEAKLIDKFGVGDKTGSNFRDALSLSCMNRFRWGLMSRHQCHVIQSKMTSCGTVGRHQ